MLILPILPKINKWNKINNSIFLPSNCTSIIKFNGKLDSTVGLPKLTKFIRDYTYLNTENLGIFIGILLGDANFNRSKANKNWPQERISFKQSIINLPYLLEVFSNISHYCSSIPRYETTKLIYKNNKPKIFGRLIIETRAYPVINILQELFIENGVKVIKPELFHYLSPIALAHWIMCDGVSNQYGLTLCTDGFKYKDVSILINILIIRYGLDCRMHIYSGKPRIYITAASMNNLRELVKPYIIPFSMYKLSKGKRYI